MYIFEYSQSIPHFLPLFTSVGAGHEAAMFGVGADELWSDVGAVDHPFTNSWSAGRASPIGVVGTHQWGPLAQFPSGFLALLKCRYNVSCIWYIIMLAKAFLPRPSFGSEFSPQMSSSGPSLSRAPHPILSPGVLRPHEDSSHFLEAPAKRKSRPQHVRSWKNHADFLWEKLFLSFFAKEVIPKLGFPAFFSDAFFFEHELIRNPPVWDGDMSCK